MHFEDNCIQIIVSDRKVIEIRKTEKNSWLHTAEKKSEKQIKARKTRESNKHFEFVYFQKFRIETYQKKSKGQASV